MIAKGTTISHGLEALNYGVDKSKAVFVAANLLSGISPEDWLIQMQLLHQGKSRMKKGFLRFEISMTHAEAKQLRNIKDWEKLAGQFLKKMDLYDNQCVILLHQDRKHLHLHIVANRVDINGNIYNDKYIGRRCGEAAKIISQERNWKSVEDISKENKYKCWNAMKNTMKSMNSYSWEDFKEGMKAQGYCITENYRKDGSINGYYILMPGQTMTEKFKGLKASEVNRNCTYSNLQRMWAKEHPELKVAQDILNWYKNKGYTGRISDATVIRRGYDGYAFRCKVDGVQQMGVAIDNRNINHAITELSYESQNNLSNAINLLLLWDDYIGVGNTDIHRRRDDDERKKKNRKL